MLVSHVRKTNRESSWSVCVASEGIDVRKDVSGWITRLNDAMIDNYTASGAWRNESIADIAARLVIEKPDMLAFIEGDRSLYLGNLVTKARKIAAVLATRGLVPGDVVSFQLPNWLETAVLNLACCIGGFVCNPLIPIYREAEEIGRASCREREGQYV